ncbi:MAG: DUF3037 domain-containing protein [Chloroflexota bacterium]
MPISFDYAAIRVVPRVDRGECINAGIILFSSTLQFLAAEVVADAKRLEALFPGIDYVQISAYLSLIPRICAGDPDSGPIGQLPLAGRFHWLVSPRSTVIQTAPVHSGFCSDPQVTLRHLMTIMVAMPDYAA